MTKLIDLSFILLILNVNEFSLIDKYFFPADMAQAVLQVSGLRDDAEHENVQRIQQTAVLRGVSKTKNNSLISFN